MSTNEAEEMPAPIIDEGSRPSFRDSKDDPGFLVAKLLDVSRWIQPPGWFGSHDFSLGSSTDYRTANFEPSRYSCCPRFGFTDHVSKWNWHRSSRWHISVAG